MWRMDQGVGGRRSRGKWPHNPRLDSVNAVVRAEEEHAVRVRQVFGIRSLAPRTDIEYEPGALRGAVALPQLLASDAVGGAEEKRAIGIGQVGGIGAGAARIDDRDEHRAGFRAIRAPELPA